jgi:hypothetical protein
MAVQNLPLARLTNPTQNTALVYWKIQQWPTAASQPENPWVVVYENVTSLPGTHNPIGILRRSYWDPSKDA